MQNLFLIKQERGKLSLCVLELSPSSHLLQPVAVARFIVCCIVFTVQY